MELRSGYAQPSAHHMLRLRWAVPPLIYEPTCGAALERRLSEHVDEPEWLVSATHFKSDTFAGLMYKTVLAQS